MKEKKTKKTNFDKFVESAKELSSVIRKDKTAYRDKVLSEKAKQSKTENTTKKFSENESNGLEKYFSLFPKEKMELFLKKINELKNSKK